jgi:non-heme chloroperoxidase
MRGHGLSDKPATGYAFDDHCRDIKNVMQALSVENATLVGWSTGGGISTKYAETIGDHIVQLGLVGPTSPRFVSNEHYPHGLPLEAVQDVIDAEILDQASNRRVVMERCFHKMPSMEFLDWIWMNSMQCPAYVGVQLMEALIAEDLIDQLPDIKVPTTIFQGRYDLFCPAEGAYFMAERIPDAEVVMFEALGHAPHLEDPASFNTAFRAFLDKI